MRFFPSWQEIDSAIVMPPTCKGFGSKMIERLLRADFDSATSLRFEPHSVTFRIATPQPAAGMTSV